jgi:hypothetical protein
MSPVSRGSHIQDQGRKAVTPFFRALCEAMIFEEPAGLEEAAKKKAVDAAAEFVQGQLNSLPLLLRVLFGFGTVGFRALVCARYFRGFTGLPLAKRSRIVTKFAWGRVALFRQLFRAVRSTALLAFYEIPEVNSAVTDSGPQEPARMGAQ